MNLTFDYGQVQYLNIGVRQNIERNKNRYENELLYQKPDLIEVMEIEIDSTIYQQMFIKVLGNAWIVDEMTKKLLSFVIIVFLLSQASYNWISSPLDFEFTRFDCIYILYDQSSIHF